MDKTGNSFQPFYQLEHRLLMVNFLAYITIRSSIGREPVYHWWKDSVHYRQPIALIMKLI